MTDFIAGAFVDVKPEAKGFRSELKRKVDDAIKGSAAFKIPVEIDPKRFKSTISGLSKGIAPVKVPIEPGTSVTALKRAFKKIVDDASRDLKVKIPVEVQAKGKVQTPTSPPPVKVPIEPGTSVAALKKLFKQRVDDATKDLKVVVPIEVKGISKIPKQQTAPAAAAAAPPPTAASKTASATKGEAIRVPIIISTTVAELKTAIKSKIDSAKKGQKIDIPIEAKGAVGKPPPLTKAVVQQNVAPKAAPVTAAASGKAIEVPIKISTTVAQLKELIKEKINSAQKGEKIVVPVELKQTGKITTTTPTQRTPASGKAADSGKVADSLEEVDKANQKTEKSSKKLTETQKRQALVAGTVKKSENDLAIATRLFAQANEQNVSTEERTQRLQEARAASTRAAKGANDLLATSEANLSLKQKSALENRVALAQTLRADITATQQKVAANKAATAVESKSIDARKEATTLIAFEAKEIQDLNSLHLKENEVLAAEAALKRQTNAARKLGLTSIAQENEAVLKNIALQKDAIVLQRQALKGDTARARSQKTAGRGAASAILSLLGIRGATLASSAAFLTGAASAAIFTKAIADFASFEQELNIFQATTGATATQMERVGKVAHANSGRHHPARRQRRGRSAGDVAACPRGPLRRGLDPGRAWCAGARLRRDDLERGRGRATASALNAFNLEGDDAVHVADLLANAANNAQGSISEMGAAMQQASAIAHQVGFTLDDTIATLTIFARHGLRGSDAGTSLRTALSRLIAPTHKAAELIGELGLNIRDANGNIKPDIFAQFGQATKDLSPALRDMIAETIAGQDAIRAFAIGASEGTRGLKLAQLQMEATGTAAAIAAARSKGLSGSFSALSSNSETLGTSLGKLASGPVKGLVGELNATLVALNQLASGDFSGFGEGIEKDFKQAEANLKKHAGGLKKFLFGKDLGESFSGLKDIFAPADNVDKEASRIEALSKVLQDLQGLRVQTFTIGGDIRPLTAKIQEIRRQLKDAKVDAGLLIPVTPLEKALAKLRTAQKTAQDIKDEILASGGSATDPFVKQLDTTLHNIAIRIKLTTKTFKDNAKNMGKAVEEVKAPDLAKAFQKEFSLIAQQPLLATPEVLSSIGDMARKIKSTGAPLTGAAGKEMGTKLIETLTAIIAQAVEDDNSDLAQDVKALGLKIAPLFGASVAEGFKNIKIPLTDQQLSDALLPSQIKTARAEAFGTISDQIAGKQGELDALNKQLGDVVKGSSQEADVLGKIRAAKDSIRSLREQLASDQKDKDAKSDKKVTDALSGRERTLTQALERAQATETLKDDLRRERDLHAFYTEQIKTLKATIKDKATRDAAVQEAEDNLFKIDQQFNEDRAGRRAQLQEAALKPIDAGIDRAAETETLKDDVKQANRKVRFWQTQVRILKDLVKQRKATADELKTASDALDDAEKDAREARKGPQAAGDRRP